MSSATDAKSIVAALSEEFPRHVIRMKPGSNKRPAMPYVSHGSCTKRLNEVCPGWSSRVVETFTYMNGNGVLCCAGVLLEMTVPFVGSRQEFGTANQPRDFGTDAKNSASDALKRCAMRFGVALDLWESAEEHDEDADDAPQPPRRAEAARPALAATTQPAPPQGQPAALAPLSHAEFVAFFEYQAAKFLTGTERPYILAAIREKRARFCDEQYKASLDWWTAFTTNDEPGMAKALGLPAPAAPTYAGVNG